MFSCTGLVEAFWGAMCDRVLLKVMEEDPRTTLSTLSFGDNLGKELFPEQCLGTGLEGAGWGHPRQ